MTRCVLAALTLGAFFAVLGYNLWAYCCGHCALENFIDPGPFGLLLAGITALACATLLTLKTCRVLRLRRQRCGCGYLAAQLWSYCPRCGGPI